MLRETFEPSHQGSQFPSTQRHQHRQAEIMSTSPSSTPTSLPCLQLTLAVSQVATVILFTLGLAKTTIEEVRRYLLCLLLPEIATKLPGNRESMFCSKEGVFFNGQCC